MKKILIIALLLFIVKGFACAQSIKPNLYFNSSVLNKTKLKFDLKDYDNDTLLKNICNVFYKCTTVGFGCEIRPKTSVLFQFDYTFGKLDSVKFNDNCPLSWRPDFKDISVYSLTFYYNCAMHFPKCQPIQFFLYPGFGIDMYAGGPIKHLFYSFKTKARMIYYMTNNFGLYTGFNWSIGASQGFASEWDKSNFNNGFIQYHNLFLNQKNMNLELGITIAL